MPAFDFGQLYHATRFAMHCPVLAAVLLPPLSGPDVGHATSRSSDPYHIQLHGHTVLTVCCYEITWSRLYAATRSRERCGMLLPGHVTVVVCCYQVTWS